MLHGPDGRGPHDAARPAFTERRYHTGHLVQTEYGADAWTQIAEAGFTEIRMGVLEYPAGIAFEAAG